MKPNPEAMLQLWLDFKSTEPELSYSRVNSILPSQSSNVETGSSAPLQAAAAPTLVHCLRAACAPVLTSSPRDTRVRLEEAGAQEDNPDHTRQTRTGQTSISCTGIKVEVGGALDISQTDLVKI